MTARKTWRCFHCDEVFRSRRYAAEHFGAEEGAAPACKLKTSESYLVQYIRELEADGARYRSETHPLLLALSAQQAEHAEALRSAEEKGYGKGVVESREELAGDGWNLVYETVYQGEDRDNPGVNAAFREFRFKKPLDLGGGR